MNQEWYDQDIDRYIAILEKILIGYVKKSISGFIRTNTEIDKRRYQCNK